MLYSRIGYKKRGNSTKVDDLITHIDFGSNNFNIIAITQQQLDNSNNMIFISSNIYLYLYRIHTHTHIDR